MNNMRQQTMLLLKRVGVTSRATLTTTTHHTTPPIDIPTPTWSLKDLQLPSTHGPSTHSLTDEQLHKVARQSLIDIRYLSNNQQKQLKKSMEGMMGMMDVLARGMVELEEKYGSGTEEEECEWFDSRQIHEARRASSDKTASPKTDGESNIIDSTKTDGDYETMEEYRVSNARSPEEERVGWYGNTGCDNRQGDQQMSQRIMKTLQKSGKMVKVFVSKEKETNPKEDLEGGWYFVHDREMNHDKNK